MKPTMKIIVFLSAMLLMLALPANVLAQTPDGNGKVVFGGSYQLNSGDTLNGSLAVFGGEATLQSGSKVNGDIALSGGTLSIKGEVSGNIVVLGGAIFLGDTAVVHGNINTVGGTVNRSPQARVDGSITNGPSNISIPFPPNLPNLNLNFDPIGRMVWAIFQAFALAAIAVLLALFLPQPTQRVSASISAQPVVAGGIGLLTAFIAPIVLVLLAVTILLLPVSLVGILAIVLAVTFGWTALGLYIGQRMAVSMFHSDWTLPVAAGIGTLSLSLVANMASIIPCVGWLAPFVVAMVGLGGVLMSRFGTQVYDRPAPISATQPPYYPPAPPPPAAPQPPQNLPGDNPPPPSA